MARARDRILIQDLEVRCIVGVYPDERRYEQGIRLDLDLGLDLSVAGRSGRIADTCDYDRLSHEIIALLQFRRYRLLEMAAEEIAAMLLGIHGGLREVGLTIVKPQALPGRARAAAVRIERDRHDFPRERRAAPFGSEEVLLETAEAGLYLLRVAPGGVIAPHLHRRTAELEWRVAGELLRDGAPLTGVGPVAWPIGQVHSYRNPSAAEALLFRCDRPPLRPEDQVDAEVSPPGDARPVELSVVERV
jgi:FolB domain-containing protein